MSKDGHIAAGHTGSVDKTQGLFTPLGCVLEHGADYRELFDADQKMAQGMSATKALMPDGTTRLLHAWLANRHEEFHFYHVLSTNLGRFMLKLLFLRHTTILGSLQSIIRAAKTANSELVFPMPLLYALGAGYQWHPTDVHDQIRHLCGVWSAYKALESTLFFNQVVDSEFPANVFGMLLPEVDHFNERFLGASGPTTKIATHRGVPSCPDQRITTFRLFEAYAFLNTGALLRGLGLHEDTVREVTMQMAGDDYIGPSLYVEEQLPGECSPVDIQWFIDLAFATPLGLTVSRGDFSELWWEDVHPGWRFARIIESIKNNRLNREESYPELSDKVLGFAGLPSLSESLAAVRGESWDFNAGEKALPAGADKDDVLSQHGLFRYLFNASDTFFNARAQYPGLFINFGLDRADSAEATVHNELRHGYGPPFRFGQRRFSYLAYEHLPPEKVVLESFSQEMVGLLSIWEIMESRSFEDSHNFISRCFAGVEPDQITWIHEMALRSYLFDIEPLVDAATIYSECPLSRSLGLWL